MQRDRIVAVGLLTERDVTLLGPTFDRAWPVEEFHHDPRAAATDDAFQQLLRAIDEADEAIVRR